MLFAQLGVGSAGLGTFVYSANVTWAPPVYICHQKMGTKTQRSLLLLV